ncbi:hypothetical protein [Marinibactrum halimedae]|uniref:Uncharacterized protein n=1 Tax=Marinibactrum halimedae TaxID=1444977 RepID=A0AA37WNF2_9GAMM|nr:hypothetical protein [Marinibactrum halimedae]MCD9460778.1 hypothetical protein [Marinibactrum halimedae]GLS27365.1 hypothetical protein GCM10007877_30840 [Marinibactrum halimedae]
MSKKVAIEGDVEIITSSAKHVEDKNATGSWIQGVLKEEKGKRISVNGKMVLVKAAMEWTYVGGTVGNPPSPIEVEKETARLMPGKTQLSDSQESVLVEGDEVTTKHGHKIRANPSQTLLTTD